MTLHTALSQGTRLLEDGGVAVPRLTAEVLLAHAMGRDRSYLFAHGEQELTEMEWLHYGRSLHRRLQGMPTQYITQRQEFYGREFRVTPDVLIPRPETEHVVEVALRHVLPGRQDSGLAKDRSLTVAAPGGAATMGSGSHHKLPVDPPVRILDIGTGSGALAVTLALEIGAETWATEISPAAAAVAARNAAALGAGVHIVACDLAGAIAAGSMSLIVSNPPYVPLAQRDGLQREVRDYEPHAALFAGPTGFEIYRRIVAGAPRVLRPGGWLVMELGFGCEASVRKMLGAWREIEVTPDLAGIPRVIAARSTDYEHP
ncbi:MAG: peptide chain release factor N(5)-glutamine methyltransferase [Bryobacteraceae bacterium]